MTAFVSLVFLGLAALIVWIIRAANKEAEALFEQILVEINAAPSDARAHQKAIELFSQMECNCQKKWSSEMYRMALNLVECHPGIIPCRVFALKVGRLHHALHRPDGKVSLYDEQAIQNDIMVRTVHSESGDIP